MRVLKNSHRLLGGDPIAIPLILFLGGLWIAGGGSRPDVAGQVLSRLLAWVMLVLIILLRDHRKLVGDRNVLALLIACIALPLLQTIPLPPAWWTRLPGREPFLQAAVVIGQKQPWRPWAIVPVAALNALFSLIVPLVTYFLVARLGRAGHLLLLRILLVLIVASTLVGLIQFSGVSLDNPLVNGSGEVNGMFANHNHFALLIAMGCLLAPVWAFQETQQSGWQQPVALGLVVLFILTILASGSRAGLIVGLLAIVLAFGITRKDARKALRRYPRWVFPVSIAAMVAIIAALVVLSVVADRAMSIHRVMTVDVSQDMRARGLPTVLQMIREYFPIGSGMGAFDPLFRMHEPFSLLKPTYFNHAHNDFLEIVLDAGLPGLLLLVWGLGWWAWTSISAWRTEAEGGPLRRTGSAMLLMVFVASAFDYPARTPMIMAVVVIAAIWLAGYGKRPDTSALPDA